MQEEARGIVMKTIGCDQSPGPACEGAIMQYRDGKTLLEHARAGLHYALQPIVNIHTGQVYGHEALLRGIESVGFSDTAALLDAAHALGVADALDMLLRGRAIAGFAELAEASRYRLFFNLDPRMLNPQRPAQTLGLLQAHGLGPESLCLAISERSLDARDRPGAGGLIADYRRRGFHVAIGDFGSAHAGLRQLYDDPPHLLKIERCFIHGIAEQRTQRLFVAHIVQFAHVLGISVIAEGVESESEFLACRELGCDLVQGFIVAEPHSDPGMLRERYGHLAEINDRNRRDPRDDRALIESCLERIPPLHISDNISGLFTAFRHDAVHHVVPVLDAADRPLGLIHDADIKGFIYSAYGRDLLVNRALGRSLHDFLRPCPSVDIHDNAERLLDAYSVDVNPAGLFVTEDARYLGFISATALLQLIEQKNLAAARDQNPLTKLPGNSPIFEYVSRALTQGHQTWHLAYFDFDNFKAFNDHYGFRRGDRAILMFAQLLRKQLAEQHWFIGHVGGDDFFAGTQGVALPDAQAQLTGLLEKFRSDVQSLYDPDDSRRGHIRAHDRFGEQREMPLMRCSAALLVIHPGDEYGNAEQLGQVIAEMKCRAKASRSGLCIHHSASAKRASG